MIEYNKFILNNGLTVIHHLDSSTPLAVINVLYNVGARDEEPDKTGFAHLFEHLMFGGSANIPNYDSPLQIAGGENNAFTNNDITNYYLTIPVNNLETGFWLESDRMLNLAFSDDSLRVQKGVVVEEFKQRYLNQPYGDVWLKLRPLAYKQHPYQWPTIGKEISHIENATMDDVRAFFKRFYNPSNAILVIAGNISLEWAKQLTEKWFGPIPSGERNKNIYSAEPVQKEGRHMEHRADVPMNAIYKAYHCCARKDQEYYSTDLLSDILSRSKSSRLYNVLVKEKRMFSEINAYLSGDLDKGLFIVEGKLSDGVTMEEGEGAILEELERIKSSVPHGTELEKVKNKVETTLVYGEINVLNKAMNLAYFELLGDASMVNEESKKYAEVTPETISLRAKEIFKEDNCSTLYYYAN